MDAERDWTNATRAPGHMLGHVLRPEQFLARARYDRAAPDPRLVRKVDAVMSDSRVQRAKSSAVVADAEALTASTGPDAR